MMYSHIENGKVLDYHFKKRVDGAYLFSVGEGVDKIVLGTIFPLPRRRWCAVPLNCNHGDLSVTDGLATRMDAAQRLLHVRRERIKYPNGASMYHGNQGQLDKDRATIALIAQVNALRSQIHTSQVTQADLDRQVTKLTKALKRTLKK